MSTLVKKSSSPSLRSMMEEFWNNDRFFTDQPVNAEFLPAVNIKDTKDNYELEVAAPGFEKEDFEIGVENGLLTISAETSREHHEEKGNYTRKEFSSTSFTRTFHLPDNVDEDHIKANYKHGLLVIDIRKATQDKTEKKKINID
jgi:HSP20 family protein